jgi:hypothetical protein
VQYKADKMERGRGQVLQRYRPEQTFDHENHFIARVTEYRPDHAYDKALPREKLIHEGLRYVQRFRSEGRNAIAGRTDSAPTFPPDGSALNMYDVVVPASLNFAYFPLSVTCGNPACRRVYVLSRAPEPGQEIPKCPTCHSDPSYQTQYLLVHGCGYARSFEPPRDCPSGCTGPAFRLNSDPSRFRDFRWICLRCGAAQELSATPAATCNNRLCQFPNKLMQPEVHTSGSAYVPHSITIVNPPSVSDARQTHTPEFRLGIVGEWLGVCTPEDFASFVNGRNRGMDPGFREALEIVRKMDPEKAAEMERKYAPLDIDALRGRIRDRIGTAADDDQSLAALASQLDTYHQTLERGAVTLADLERDALSETRRMLYRHYPAVFRQAGLDPATIVLAENFPVIELAVGYSRGGYTAREADLRSFTMAAGRGQATKTVLYAHPQESEALIFGFDRARLGRWLDVNGLASLQDTGGADGIVHWFARYLSRRGDELEWIEFGDQPAAEDRAGDAVCRLLHTMAHQFIRALFVHSGFMETSLSEHFFPLHLAFAIYPRANSEFVIGGLRTVIEQNLDEVVRQAVENDSCIYDPNCMFANQGADNGCLFLPETACRFRDRNTHLSRWELFGSPGGSRIGYWDQVLDA